MVIDFEDNGLLKILFGQYDENLAQLERDLDVSIVSRGNRLAIEGAPGACDLTRDVLRALYAKVAEGDSLSKGDIDGAVRMIRAEQTTIVQDSDDRPKRSSSNIRIVTRNRTITPRSPRQAAYLEALTAEEMVFGVGPAGTGKTYLAVAMAVSAMLKGEVDRVIVSRPAVEAGENLGFLPGDMREKVDPYLRPIYDALYDMLPADQVEKRLANGQIEIAPLAFMRGRTLANAYVILDEAQNTTPMQMKMFLTRFGENSRMVIAGDPSQVDLPGATRSGLAQAVDLLRDVDGISIVRFTNEDVVRHPLVGRIVEAYDHGHEREAGPAASLPPHETKD